MPQTSLRRGFGGRIGFMSGLYDSPPPVVEVPRKRGPAGLVLLILAGIVLLEIPAYLLWNRTRRAERDLAALNREAQVLRSGVVQAQMQSGAAVTQASRAEASAVQAAQQRDQALAAQTQSQQAAAVAQFQASLADQQANQAHQQAAAAQQQAQTLMAQREAQLEHLRAVLSHIASTRRTASGLVVTLDSNAIRFDFDKSTLRPGNRELLSRMAGVLMTLQGYHVYIYGYTDDVGTAQYNQKLSERRAEAVRDYLVQSGVDPNIMDTKGYGKNDPLEQGDSAQARAKNRRVEIGIVDSVLQMVGVVK